MGGSGFIGTRLVPRLLDGGYRVTIADIAPSVRFPELRQPCDVRCYEDVRRACEGADLICNLAAAHRDDVRPLSLYHDVNVRGAENVCRAAAEAGVRRIVFTSSVAVYGSSPVELDEHAETHPFNEYGRSKLAAEAVYQQWHQASPDRGLTIVRPTVVFGEDNRGNFYNLARQIAGRRFVLVGQGTNRKSVAYVENVAAFLEFVMQFGSGERLFNYVDKPDLDMNALVALIRRELGRPGQVRVRLPYWLAYGIGMGCDLVARVTRRPLLLSAVRVAKFCANTQFSAARAQALGFAPPVDLPTAIRRTIQKEFLDGALCDAAVHSTQDEVESPAEAEPGPPNT